MKASWINRRSENAGAESKSKAPVSVGNMLPLRLPLPMLTNGDQICNSLANVSHFTRSERPLARLANEE